MAHDNVGQDVGVRLDPEAVHDTEPIVREPIFESIVRRLRQDIVDGVYPPGRPLRMQALARRFGTSLMPVREALHRLAAEELVVMNPRRGASVVRLDAAQVRDTLDFVKVLMGVAARMAVPHLDNGDVAFLEARVGDMDANLEGGQPDVRIHNRLNTAFHDRIATRCPNPRFAAAGRNYETFCNMLWRTISFSAGRLRESNAEHEEMLACIRRGDGAALERLTHLHYDNALGALLAALESSAHGAPRTAAAGRGGSA